MVNTHYSYANCLHIFSSNAFSWIKAHGRLVASISAVAIGILSVFAAISIRRLNPGLGAIFYLISGCCFSFPLIILGQKKSDQVENSHQSGYTPAYSSSSGSSASESGQVESSGSSSSASEDDWSDFSD